MTLEEFEKFWFQEIKWCGCGIPHEAAQFMGETLCLIETMSDFDKEDYETHYRETAKELLKKFHNDEVLLYSYLYVINSYKLITHSTEITGSILTEKGKEILQFIQSEEFKRFCTD